MAESHLLSLGYEVLRRNYRCRRGEVDLVVHRGGHLCFVEVKLRQTGHFGGAAHAIGWKKKRTMQAVAESFLLRFQPEFEEVTLGAVLIDAQVDHWRVRFLPNAFDGV